MNALRKCLMDEIECKQDALARAESDLASVPAELLDLAVPCHRMWVFSRTAPDYQLEIMYETATPEEQRTVVAFLMDVLGVSSGTKEEDASHRSAVTFFPVDGVKIFVNMPSPDCDKRARVVTPAKEHIITFCGTLDESKYTVVEYLGQGKEKEVTS